MFRFLSAYGITLICSLTWLTNETIDCENEGNDIVSTTVDISNATETNKILLNCSVLGRNATLTWTFQSSFTGAKKVIPTTNLTLMISSSTQTGNYECAVGDSVISKFNAWNFSNPHIPHTGRSIIFTEGSVNQTVECFAFSYPHSIITWTVNFTDGSNPITLSGSGNDKFSIIESMPGWSILTISTVTFSDRGTYSCKAASEELNITASSSAVLIRIHGRLKPLWPFLGIVCEILLVAFIIVAVRRQPTTAEKGLGSPFQDSNCSESFQDAANSSVRFRGGRN